METSVEKSLAGGDYSTPLNEPAQRSIERRAHETHARSPRRLSPRAARRAARHRCALPAEFKSKLHRFFDRFELYDIKKDETEANNVADAHADVVKLLTAKMDAWAGSLGAALSHQPAPAKYHAPAAPEGEVLAVTVTVTDKA